MGLINIGSEVFDHIHFLWRLFAQSHVDALDAEIASNCDCSVDVVAEGLEKLCSLGFDDIRSLLVASVKSQAYKLLRVIIHLLSLCFCSLNEI